jgi:hypothetical protein
MSDRDVRLVQTCYPQIWMRSAAAWRPAHPVRAQNDRKLTAVRSYEPLRLVQSHFGTGPTPVISKPGCDATTAIAAPHRM